MRTHDLPPDAPTLMEATRAIGYSLEAAVADIIDNSIAAKATKIDIRFFPIGDAYVAILDNGTGMDEAELTAAMRYGSKSPNDKRDSSDLGRFGLGLKTASLSQCRRLTVISLKDGVLAGAQWDLDYVIYTSAWSLRLLDQDDMVNYPHVDQLFTNGAGTIVIWQELDRLKAGELDFEAVMGQKMDRVREHVALVFHRYMYGETGIHKIELSVNGSKVVPIDPFVSGKSTQSMDDECISVEGQTVVVRPYVLPHISALTADELKVLGGKDGLRRQQGFYVYRNRRLLVWGTWFRMLRQGELSKLARVRVDLPNSLDHLWTLDIKKSTAVPPEVVRKNLITIAGRIAEGSQRAWTFRGKKETDDSSIHVWNRSRTRAGGILYEINRDYPLVQVLDNIHPASKRAVEHLLVEIERNLPLNALYSDMAQDERIDSESELTENDLRPVLAHLLASCKDGAERKDVLERMVLVEPFSRYPELTAKLLREVD